ncbi:MAG: hypothetical protein A2Y38_17390 [Spirochaetes bacterium GWB1_59_5]|nr:MAG: hypothetical protein A2Y38_17390 [Spirochaetes bacterium GWB1_59_5]
MKISGKEKLKMAEAALQEAHQSRRGWWRAPCPFCDLFHSKHDRKASFGINTETGWYHCFRCGTKGKLPNIGEEIEERDRALAAQPPAIMRAPEDYTPLWEEPGKTAECLDAARDYLLNGRATRITRKMWREAQIGACAVGRYAGRVIVPILDKDEDGNQTWLGWSGRAWWNKPKPKRPYIYPDDMARGEIIYNHGALHEVTDEPVIVVEGVFDAIACWPSGVALLGDISDSQYEALLLAKRPVAVVLDGDAIDKGWALSTRLRFNNVRAGCVLLPPTLDPDQIPIETLKESALKCIASGQVRL